MVILEISLAIGSVVAAGLALLQLKWMPFRRLGLGLLWLSSGATIYFVSGSPALGLFTLAAWIFFPAWELVFVLRKLRLPRRRQLVTARAPQDEFEELIELTAELRALGFEQLDECRLEPATHDQYYRSFSRPDGQVQATIGYIAQGTIGFHFLIFSSETPDHRRWVTWDYPLTYGLLMPPHVAVYRVLQCNSIAELYQAHRDFLAANDLAEPHLVAAPLTPEAARARLEQTLDQQIEYNVQRGFLSPASTSPVDENFSYSWRGTFYVAGQVLRDFLW